jgi:large subunit ribosomal protein L10
MATPKKIQVVEELTQKVAQARAIVMTDYQGLTHKQLEELRRALKKVAAEFTVTKNTLLRRALSANHKTIPEAGLNSTTGTLFAFKDEASPVKELAKFFKAINMGKIKAGLLGNTEISEAEVNRLATLPARDQLIGQLVGQLKGPLYGLHNALSWNLRQLVWTLDAVKTKKS